MAKGRKLPALQWYPGDWRKDIAVQSLSFHDRGVWFEMLMMMHDSGRRGELVLNGHPMGDEVIARAIGLDIQTFNQTLSTLLTLGVAERDPETGAIINRRMVRDEKVRQAHQEAGKKGGNPSLVNQTANQNGYQIRNQKPTPSSSSSTSVVSDAKASSSPRKRRAEPTKTALAESRHAAFKEALKRYWDFKNPEMEMPWGPGEGRNLDMWLRESPTTTVEQFTGLLRNRAKSEVNHADRPSVWIHNVNRFANGPIDRYGNPLDNAETKPTIRLLKPGEEVH